MVWNIIIILFLSLILLLSFFYIRKNSGHYLLSNSDRNVFVQFIPIKI